MNSDINLAREMATFGEQMDLETDAVYSRLLTAFSLSSHFSIAVTYALTWTGHAVHDSDYLDCAIGFLDSGQLNVLQKAEHYGGRFGEERLSNALKAWRAIVERSGDLSLFERDAASLKRGQDSLYGLARRMRKKREILGIGAWLFCAPFKILAIHNRQLWLEPALDDVLMPLGQEVIRGVRKLVKARSRWAQGIDSGMLEEEEGDLEEGMATVYLVQDLSRKIAEASASRIVHVNSGLFLHGRAGIENAPEEMEKLFRN